MLCMYQDTSFLWLNNIPLYRYAIFCLSIRQLMDISVVSTFLASMSNNAMTTHLQVFVWTCVFDFLGYIISRGIAGSQGNCNCLRNCQTIFHSCCIILHSHHQSMRVAFSPTHVKVVFSKIAILVGVRWYLLVFICISLMANDVEHFYVLIGHLYILFGKMSV